MAYEIPDFRLGELCADQDLSDFVPQSFGNQYTYQFVPVWVGAAQFIIGHGIGGAAIQLYTFTGSGGSTVTQAGPPVGILQNPARQKEACNVVVSGVSKILANGTWAVGDPIGWDANGKAIKAVTGKYAFGTALESAVAGNVSTILLLPRGVQ